MQPDNWLSFASEDYQGAEILLREGKYGLACFHSQQAAEKILKGYLASKRLNTPRTHNLIDLINMCMKFDGSFVNYFPHMATLNQFYVPTRYPDAAIGSLPSGMPGKAVAEQALSYAREIISHCQEKLKIKDKGLLR